MDVKDLIGVLVEQNKAYKDMLQFAVGSIITLLVIFLTANFFTMKKIRNDEIEKIKAEIILGIKENAIPDIEKDFEEFIHSKIRENINSLDTKINSIDTRLNKTNETQHTQIKRFNNDIHRLKGELYYLRAEIEMSKEVYANSFQFFLQAGEHYISADRSGDMFSILNNVEHSAENLDVVLAELSEFRSFANKLGEVYQDQANKIIDILKSKKTMQ